jgi:hypothetical protein
MGDPAKSILDLCRKDRVDLVIMTTRGRGGFRRAMMGSVADEVIRLEFYTGHIWGIAEEKDVPSWHEAGGRGR